MTPVGIVTGASRGLGLALARALAKRDWRLVVDARGTDALERAVTRLKDVVAIPGDITDSRHRRALVEAAGGRIDLLVNNAGLLGPSPQPTLAAYPLSALARVYDVNVFAPLALVQEALPRLVPGAAIVAISSDAAVEPYAGWGGYGSSKAALEQMTAILAVEQPRLRVYGSTPATCVRRPIRRRSQVRTSPTCRPPEESVPGLLALIEGSLPSGRYRARELAGVAA